MTMPELFEKAVPLLKSIEMSGYEAYFVGGCVRDYLLSRTINDVDIATSARPEEIKQIFERTVDVGIEHGTVMVIENGIGFEITTFRSESTYSDFRRPDEVTFVRSLKEDLKRRDFTINAMAMSTDMELIDWFNGQMDLKNKKIRTVGKAEERFQEDALRMMRGARFASQLNFEIEKNTLTAIKKNASLLKHIAIERKRMEMDKLLLGQSMVDGLEQLFQSDLYHHLPNLYMTRDVIKRLDEMNLTDLTLEQRWALLLILVKNGDPYTMLKNWRHSNKRIADIANLIKFYTKRNNESWHNELLFRSGINVAVEVEQIYSVLNKVPTDVQHVNELWNSLKLKKREDLQVNGNDLISWMNRDPGPWIGDCLTKIETLIILNQLKNNTSDIKKWVKQWQQK